MGTLKKATVKSSTFWINLFVALAGAALVYFQNVFTEQGATEVVTTPVINVSATAIPPDAVSLIADILGMSTNADVVGVITIVLAIVNQLLRYKTQHKLEKQAND